MPRTSSGPWRVNWPGCEVHDMSSDIIDCPFSPFVAVQTDSSVRGATNQGVSLYNQIRYNAYMRRLVDSGVDAVEHSHRISVGLAVQARLNRSIQIRDRSRPKLRAVRSRS